jgi:hypothetical protein
VNSIQAYRDEIEFRRDTVTVRRTKGALPPRDNFLYPSDGADEFRIPSEVVDWTWKIKL